MDVLTNLALGFQTAMSLANLAYCLVGVFLGTAVGVLPGIGPIATIAMLLPVTFGLPPVSALIMLSGIYYGAQYGGSTTAILINLPGESSSVVTALDGYKMARQGVEIPREPRLVHIYSFKFSEYEEPFAYFRVSCTKGTYVRSLAHDLGQKLGCGAHLSRLRRLGSGRFDVADATPLAEVLQWTEAELEQHVIPFLKLKAHE